VVSDLLDNLKVYNNCMMTFHTYKVQVENRFFDQVPLIWPRTLGSVLGHFGPNQGYRIHQWGSSDDPVLWFGSSSIKSNWTRAICTFIADFNLGIRFRNIYFQKKLISYQISVVCIDSCFVWASAVPQSPPNASSWLRKGMALDCFFFS
jgi:hypothetical protein